MNLCLKSYIHLLPLFFPIFTYVDLEAPEYASDPQHSLWESLGVPYFSLQFNSNFSNLTKFS